LKSLEENHKNSLSNEDLDVEDNDSDKSSSVSKPTDTIEKEKDY